MCSNCNCSHSYTTLVLPNTTDLQVETEKLWPCLLLRLCDLLSSFLEQGVLPDRLAGFGKAMLSTVFIE